MEEGSQTSARILSHGETAMIGALTKKQFAGTIVGLQLTLLLAALDQTIVTTAMPRIVDDVGGFAQYAWATSSYLLAQTISVPVFARLSDIKGRKNLLLLGTLIFTIASVVCGCAGMLHSQTGMNELVAARALQGVGGGMMLGLIFTVIADMVPPAERGRYQGHFAAVFALASIAGPTLGGWVADNLSWRWLFFVNIPLGLLAMAVFFYYYPERRVQKKSGKLDFLGAAIFIGTLVPLLLGLSSLALYDWKTIWVIGFLAAAALMCCVFVVVELKAEEPLLPLSLFARPLMCICSMSLFVTGVGMFGSVLLIPLFLQTVVGVSAAVSGALLSPLIIAVAIASVVGGLIMSNTGKYKSLILFALLLMTAGTYNLSKIDASSPLTFILAYMLVTGAGMGLLLPIYTVVIQNSVSQDEVGTVTGFSSFFRSIGGTIGVALFGSLMLNSYKRELSSYLPLNLPDSVLSVLNDPLAPGKMRLQLETMAAHNQIADAGVLVDSVRHALVSSIDGIFMIYAGALAIILILSLWLEELPLRSTNATDVQ